ncbi:hypothetical protein BS50DRAFT_583113 [Corynespora cassiicola Philippines]|uniref:Uncharacterized protein n=1 Tax=Corynespora cassiicola Philippines TaxID=1448308 RepID=A0A2T2P7Q6_CORCC|nr:hypothetical protein BS50DRAFT_583113 [Corynespora cassiicola Philippines]
MLAQALILCILRAELKKTANESLHRPKSTQNPVWAWSIVPHHERHWETFERPRYTNPFQPSLLEVTTCTNRSYKRIPSDVTGKELITAVHAAKLRQAPMLSTTQGALGNPEGDPENSVELSINNSLVTSSFPLFEETRNGRSDKTTTVEIRLSMSLQLFAKYLPTMLLSGKELRIEDHKLPLLNLCPLISSQSIAEEPKMVTEKVKPRPRSWVAKEAMEPPLPILSDMFPLFGIRPRNAQEGIDITALQAVLIDQSPQQDTQCVLVVPKPQRAAVAACITDNFLESTFQINDAHEGIITATEDSFFDWEEEIEPPEDPLPNLSGYGLKAQALRELVLKRTHGHQKRFPMELYQLIEAAKDDWGCDGFGPEGVDKEGYLIPGSFEDRFCNKLPGYLKDSLIDYIDHQQFLETNNRLGKTWKFLPGYRLDKTYAAWEDFEAMTCHLRQYVRVEHQKNKGLQEKIDLYWAHRGKCYEILRNEYFEAQYDHAGENMHSWMTHEEEMNLNLRADYYPYARLPNRTGWNWDSREMALLPVKLVEHSDKFPKTVFVRDYPDWRPYKPGSDTSVDVFPPCKEGRSARDALEQYRTEKSAVPPAFIKWYQEKYDVIPEKLLYSSGNSSSSDPTSRTSPPFSVGDPLRATNRMASRFGVDVDQQKGDDQHVQYETTANYGHKWGQYYTYESRARGYEMEKWMEEQLRILWLPHSKS